MSDQFEDFYHAGKKRFLEGVADGTISPLDEEMYSRERAMGHVIGPIEEPLQVVADVEKIARVRAVLAQYDPQGTYGYIIEEIKEALGDELEA